MRELVCSTTMQKPIIALVDPDVSRGGLTAADVRRQLLECVINLDPLTSGCCLGCCCSCERRGRWIETRLHRAEGSYAKWGFDAETTPLSQVLYDHLFASEAIEWNRARPNAPQRVPPPQNKPPE